MEHRGKRGNAGETVERGRHSQPKQIHAVFLAVFTVSITFCDSSPGLAGRSHDSGPRIARLSIAWMPISRAIATLAVLSLGGTVRGFGVPDANVGPLVANQPCGLS